MNISYKNWHQGPVGFSTIFIKDDEFDFKDRNKFQGQKYMDCHGDIYKIIFVKFPEESWTRFLKFVPHFYKGNLVFERTKDKIVLEDLRKDVLIKFRNALAVDESYQNPYITRVKNAHLFEQIVDHHQE